MADLTYNNPVVGTIRPSVEDDCYTIGRHMRQQDALEMWNYFHLSPLDATLNSFRESLISMTIEKDGVPIAMFGIMNKQEPTLWMLTTDSLKMINRIFVRNTKEWINKMLVDYPVIIAYCDVRNRASERWLKFVGGKMIDTVFMGIDDMPFRKFEFTCKN